jgi:hypothetical protein
MTPIQQMTLTMTILTKIWTYKPLRRLVVLDTNVVTLNTQTHRYISKSTPIHY